jgi:hypothetical protein
MGCIDRSRAGRVWLLVGMLTAACCMTLMTALPVSGQAFTMGDGRLEISGSEQWREWTLPTHAVTVTGDGAVTPRLFRSRYNVLDDRETFSRKLGEFRRRSKQHAVLNIDSTETLDVKGNVITQKKSGVTSPVYTYLMRMGISRAGSNIAAAANILDGDVNTYWEPAVEDSIDAWWVEVDLARVVSVDSLVLHFVDAGNGEPFRQFRVLAAPNQEPILEDAGKVNFELIARTTAPNREQRAFSFPLAQRQASPEWIGKMVETIRIIVTETKAGRFDQVTQAEWEALDPSDKGDVVPFIRDEDGFEEPVDMEVYVTLDVERQGRLDYYRRERPRLADIEVWGNGDNLGPGIVAGGGTLNLSGGAFSAAGGFDGDFATQFLHAVREKTAIVDRGVLTVDLGATFWLDEVRTSSTQPRTFIDGYLMRGSDGSLDTGGQLKWSRLSPLEREDNRTDLYEHLREPFSASSVIRFLEITIINPEAGALCMFCAGPNIAEYQLFTEGYPAEVVLVSDLVELPPGRNLGAIEWEADVPPGTELGIRTRTGNLRKTVVRYFDKSSTEIPQKQWNNLLGSFKGPVDTVFVNGSDWSNWSRSYQSQGELVTSPAQKSFLQLEVRLKTKDRNAAASIRSISIDMLDPAAERLLAEIWPMSAPEPGRIDTFSAFMLPFFVESPATIRSGGFDEFVLTLSGGSKLDLVDVSVGLGEDGDPGEVFRVTGAGQLMSDSGAILEILADGADSIRVRFPEILQAESLVDGRRLFHRITSIADQVPVGPDGQLLTVASYGLLPNEERGDQLFFRKEVDASGQISLTPVDEFAFDEIHEASREARYFRILTDDDGQYLFDAVGDTLDDDSYRALPSSQRGHITGTGPLLRVRFAAPVFVNGATLDLAVRNTKGGVDLDAPWQRVEAGDATKLVASEILTIQVPFSTEPLADLSVAPNPFTPNGDGVNDELEIGFSVFKISGQREVAVTVYRLDGSRVWADRRMVSSGTERVIWAGTDQKGGLVPPGIYICQVDLDVDSDRSRSSLIRVVHVAY